MTCILTHTSIGGLVGEVAYDSTNQSLIQNITCNGTTYSINDCIISEGSCTCQEVISLTCFGKRNSCRRLYMYLYGHTIEPTGCEEGAVRITDGLIENKGRLEVCVNGVWIMKDKEGKKVVTKMGQNGIPDNLPLLTRVYSIHRAWP